MIVAQHAKSTQAAVKATRNAPPRSFQHLSSSCWRELNVGHDRKNGSKQYEAAFDIGHTLSDAAAAIVKGCEESNRVETRTSANETLGKISKSLLLCDHGEIRKVIMNDTVPDDLAEAMMKVVKSMDEEELDQLRDTEAAERIRWVNKEMMAYSIKAYGGIKAILDDDED